MKTIRKLRLVVLTLSGVCISVGGLAAKEPFFEGLGGYQRKITTAAPEAQRYFNQGLAFLHGFNHGAAIRSFEEAARLDPQCAMAHWGVMLAYAAMMTGQRVLAMKHIRAMVAEMPADFLKKNAL